MDNLDILTQASKNRPPGPTDKIQETAGPSGSSKDQGRVHKPVALRPTMNSVEVRIKVIEMFARGYTIRKIAKELTAITGDVPEERELVRFYNDYASDIDEYREEMAKRVMTTGLARKEARIMRLTELSEEWEDRAKSDPKAAQVYLKSLDQIRNETQELGIRAFTPDDPWYLIVVQLKELSGTPTEEVILEGEFQDQQDSLSITSTSKGPTNNKSE